MPTWHIIAGIATLNIAAVTFAIFVLLVVVIAAAAAAAVEVAETHAAHSESMRCAIDHHAGLGYRSTRIAAAS